MPAERPDCVPAEGLERLVTRAGAEEDRLRVLDHVMQCHACRQEFELLRSAHEAGRRRTRRFRIPVSALAAMLVVAVVGGVLWLGPGADPDVFRGTGPDGALLAPVGVVEGRPVQLLWSAQPEAVRYQADILSPAGAPLFSETTADTVLAVPADLVLPPGETLQWRIRAVLPGGVTHLLGVESFRIR